MSTTMEKNRALEALRRNVSGKVESGEATPVVAMESNTYHVARFDHERAARTLFDDLKTLKVARVTLFVEPRDGKSDGGAVYIAIPEDVDPDEHMTAVKNFSLGRGSHTVTREQVSTWH